MRAMAVSGFSGFGALGLDHFGELAPRGIEVFVNYSVFKFPGMPQLLTGVLQPPADHDFGILAARTHAPLELLDRGRQDEDADAIRVKTAHLLRPLPVDFQDQVFTALHCIEDHLLGSAVMVAVHLGALEEFAPLLHDGKGSFIHEVVVDAVLFARPRRPRRVGDRDLQAGIVAHDGVDERSLARAGRSSDDEQLSAHSRFCTCSRICSMSSLSSSAQSEMGAVAALEASVFASRLSSWAMKSRRFPTAPPAPSTRSTSAMCVPRRVSSSSTSTLEANSASSARTRSSSTEPSMSFRRSASFA